MKLKCVLSSSGGRSSLVEGVEVMDDLANFNFEIHDLKFFSFPHAAIVEAKQNKGNLGSGKAIREELTPSSAALHQKNTESCRWVVVGSCGRGVRRISQAQCVARLCGCPKRTNP